jgi:hypothetical protein
MRSRSWHLFVFLTLSSAAWCSIRVAHPDDQPSESGDWDRDRPFLAIWRRDDGFVSKSEAPYLRLAIWDDGRVLFAEDPDKWGHELLRGKIAAYRVVRLKQALIDTGVFDLKGHCYLGPDLPTDCIMIAIAEKKQMLYWVEGMMTWVESKPHRVEFVKCWKAVNNLGLVACPDDFEPAGERFRQAPKSWYLKKAIQSE